MSLKPLRMPFDSAGVYKKNMEDDKEKIPDSFYEGLRQCEKLHEDTKELEKIIEKIKKWDTYVTQEKSF